MKLTKLGKVVFTILLVIISIIVYISLGKVGETSITTNLKEFLAIIGWVWLFAQPFTLSVIWDK